jgi:TRAP-type mannitol/chloroaromatic compound transport system permease large subunit
MVMILLAASTTVGAVFSAFGTPKFLADTLLTFNLHPGIFLLGILGACFILGWPLEWIPIVVVIIPMFMPILISLKVDKVWFAILVAVTLQSCWLSPPVALSAYYLKGVIPEWDLKLIYKGMMPFLFLQAICIVLLYLFPQITLLLPNLLFGR